MSHFVSIVFHVAVASGIALYFATIALVVL